MKAARIRKNNKKENVETIEQGYSVKTMLLLTLILAIVFIIFYFITTLVVKPVEQIENKPITELDLSKITVNNIFNRSEEEYYVLATQKSLYSKSNYSSINYEDIYNKYINDYSSKEESLPFYTVDLDDAFNKAYVGTDLNVTENLDDLMLNNEVLFKISDGKISKYYVGNTEIVKALKKL